MKLLAKGNYLYKGHVIYKWHDEYRASKRGSIGLYYTGKTLKEVKTKINNAIKSGNI